MRLMHINHVPVINYYFRGLKYCHTHTWMSIINPSTPAKPFMTKLQNLFVSLVNMDIYQMALEFFHIHTEMPIVAFSSLLCEKKIQWYNVTPSGNRTQALRFQVQHAPSWATEAIACKAKTLGSLYSRALLILTQSSKSKNQVVHEQKFKISQVASAQLGYRAFSYSLWKIRLQLSLFTVDCNCNFLTILWAHFCVCRRAQCLHIYAVSAPLKCYQTFLNSP